VLKSSPSSRPGVLRGGDECHSSACCGGVESERPHRNRVPLTFAQLVQVDGFASTLSLVITGSGVMYSGVCTLSFSPVSQ
jgi:hypothetical protein